MRFADVQLKPSPTALPGSAVLQQFANGLAAWALIGALIALLSGRPCGPSVVTRKICTNLQLGVAP